MQILLSFLKEPSNPAEPSPSSGPDVWQTLDAQQRNESVSVLARLLAKTVVATAKASPARKRKGDGHE
jgi:hypothetical protein